MHAIFLRVLKQLNQFGRHMSQALKISENFRQSQVTEGLSELVPDTVTALKKIEKISCCLWPAESKKFQLF